MEYPLLLLGDYCIVGNKRTAHNLTELENTSEVNTLFQCVNCLSLFKTTPKFIERYASFWRNIKNTKKEMIYVKIQQEIN